MIADTLSTLENSGNVVEVSLSHELVTLLSDQLYQSPLKAIEELVVNSFDAEAANCYVYVPDFSVSNDSFVAVFDDGIGMDYAGLLNLWQIGRSNKREEAVYLLRKRKQIGKFGIGKLATNTIANSLTYVTKSVLKKSVVRAYTCPSSGINRELL